MSRLLFVLIVALLAVPATAAAAPPPNDDRANPQVIDELPARVSGTTVEATSEADDPGSRCAGSRNSVWYQFRAGADGRVFVRLQADGDLDGVVDVYRKNRSQLEAVDCDPTDQDGLASIGMNVKDNTTYLIRVAQLNNSVEGTFTLQLDRATPAAKAPGTPLPAGGRHDSVDRVLNPSDAWSVRFATGETYRINLATPVVEGTSRCVRLELYGPGTKDFDAATPRRTKNCGGYFLFTPRPEDRGRYSLLVTAIRGRGSLPYNIEVAHAGADDTAPGIFVRNQRTVSGEISANRIDVVDLYRFDVRKRSTLNLDLKTTQPIDLVLLNDRGRRLECSCLGEGDQSIARRIAPGRYFAAVRGQRGASGRYRLKRLSRVITHTKLLVDGKHSNTATPGSTVRFGIRVSPGANGPVNLVIERFDPLAGWLFVSRVHTRAVDVVQVVPFTPPTVGRWRARARFLGTRTAASSRSKFARVLIAGPLSE